jgi:hypothetical protein
VLCCIAALAGCGRGGSEDPTPPTTASTTPVGTTPAGTAQASTTPTSTTPTETASTSPSPTGTAPADDWAVLRQRPLKLPAMTAQGCPVDAIHDVSGWPVLGPGPFYPVGLAPDAVLHYGKFPDGGPWEGDKVLWIAPPDFMGRALIRGGQLDGPNEVRFEEGANPDTEMRLDTTLYPQPGQWYNRPSYTRVRGSPGCYAYQVDGLDFSYTIVFRAEPAPP